MTIKYIAGVYPTISEELANLLKNLDNTENISNFSSLNLSDERKKVLLDVLNGKIELNYFIKFDIQLFALKHFFPEKFTSLSINEHIYSKADNYEYDPAKNGQNIIKHGLSFSEVVSYSRLFGTLLVSCPDQNDTTRTVIFSDLSQFKMKEGLHLPLNKKMESTDSCVLSITTNVNGKFRFISSRVLSKQRFSKNMKNAFKGIYDNDNDKKKKKAFVFECVKVLQKSGLIGS